MSYFERFEKGFYDIKSNGNFTLATDLMTRVKVRAGILEEISLYDTYDVPTGDRPEDVAYYHFGSAKLHFVILLTNNITDRYHQWPMEEQTFIDYVNDKYTDPNGIHHYEITTSSGKATQRGTIDYTHLIEVSSDVAGATSVTNYEYERREQDKRRSIKLLKTEYLQAFLDEFATLVGA